MLFFVGLEGQNCYITKLRGRFYSFFCKNHNFEKVKGLKLLLSKKKLKYRRPPKKTIPVEIQKSWR